LSWIDVGCGTGAFTQLLLERCAPERVSAVDPSAEQIAYARTTTAAKRADFQTGDAQALAFRNGEFDAGTMALVIAFVADPNKAMAELKRVTKPAGMIGAYMWDFLNKGSPRQRLNDAVGRMGVAVQHPPGYAHSRMEAMEGYCNDVVQKIRNTSAADVERLKADLRASLTKDKSGHIAYKVKANAVKGRGPA